MKQTFETIEVQTSALREAYEPTMLNLQSLLPRATEHMKSLIDHDKKRRSDFILAWSNEYQKYNNYLDDLDIYNKNVSSLKNRLLGKKFTPPVEVQNPCFIDISAWCYPSYSNKIKRLFEECFEALLPCNYSDKIKMTAEQLQRVEYFRSGKALKDALDWLDNTPKQP